jgi:ferric-dicitrate binding protein FerR (iron transport regulator)
MQRMFSDFARRPAAICDRRAFVAGALAVGASLALPVSAIAADAVGKVESAQGSSTGLLEGIIRDLASGADVHLLEIVQTGQGARLGLALGEATRLKLGERTRIKIEQDIVERGGELILARGALLFERPDSGDHGNVVVKTPFAIIAARGTRFWTGPSNEVIGVFVESGRVNVRNRGGSVTLTAGEGTDLIAPDVAPTPPKRWGEARIAAALATVN